MASSNVAIVNNDDSHLDFRSSGLFPLFIQSNISNKLVFLNYWKLRGPKVICFVLRLRNLQGVVIGARVYEPNWTGAVELEIESEFSREISVLPHGYSGSVEFEVFFMEKPRFTYPAVSLVYSSAKGSSVVHTSSRILNRNEEISDKFLGAPQTGVDIILAENFENYLAFFMGNEESYNIELTLTDSNKTWVKEERVTGSLGGLAILSLDFLGEVPQKLISRKPKLTIQSRNSDVFPRYICMTKNTETPTPTLTHTFFDIRTEVENNPSLLNDAITHHKFDGFHSSTFLIPFFDPSEFITSIETYDCIAPFTGSIVFRLRSLDGKIIDERKFDTYPGGFFQRRESIMIDKLFKIESRSNDLQFEFVLLESNHVPLRQKIGLNIRKKSTAVGTNICFSPHVLVPTTNFDSLKHRWFPLGGADRFIGTIHNTNYFASESDSRLFSVTIYRNDGNEFQCAYQIKPGGWISLSAKTTPDIFEFLGNQLGYAYVSSQGLPFDSYFFTIKENHVGGDHAF